MNLQNALSIAGVPEGRQAEALASIALAQSRSGGLTPHKLKTRLLLADKLSKLIEWEDERLCLKHPELAPHDIAPVISITTHGDNPPWVVTPEGGRQIANAWLNKDPESDEYKEAVEANYWCKGEHPRSRKSVKAWLARNGGEYEAWARGEEVFPERGMEVWRGSKGFFHVKVVAASGAWIVTTVRNFGLFRITTRDGFEVDNVFGGWLAPQSWFPIDDHKLKGPVTCGFRIRAGWKERAQPAEWEASLIISTPGNGEKTYARWLGQ